MSAIQINVKVRGQTDLALLVATTEGSDWVPRSQIQEVIEEPGLMGPEITAIVIPEWLAHMKGLITRGTDQNTQDMFGGES